MMFCAAFFFPGDAVARSKRKNKKPDCRKNACAFPSAARLSSLRRPVAFRPLLTKSLALSGILFFFY